MILRKKGTVRVLVQLARTYQVLQNGSRHVKSGSIELASTNGDCVNSSQHMGPTWSIGVALENLQIELYSSCWTSLSTNVD